MRNTSSIHTSLAHIYLGGLPEEYARFIESRLYIPRLGRLMEAFNWVEGQSLPQKLVVFLYEGYMMPQSSSPTSLVEVWKLFMMKNAPESKIIVIGHQSDCISPNYLRLHHLPSDLCAFVQKALPVTERYWLPVPPNTFLPKLQEIFRTHKSSSIQDKLIHLRAGLKIALDKVLQARLSIGEAFDELEVCEDFRIFYNRWTEYFPSYFEYLPFCYLFHQFDSPLRQLKHLIERRQANVSVKELVSLIDEVCKLRLSIDSLYDAYIADYHYPKKQIFHNLTGFREVA